MGDFLTSRTVPCGVVHTTLKKQHGCVFRTVASPQSYTISVYHISTPIYTRGVHKFFLSHTTHDFLSHIAIHICSVPRLRSANLFIKILSWDEVVTLTECFCRKYHLRFFYKYGYVVGIILNSVSHSR